MGKIQNCNLIFWPKYAEDGRGDPTPCKMVALVESASLCRTRRKHAQHCSDKNSHWWFDLHIILFFLATMLDEKVGGGCSTASVVQRLTPKIGWYLEKVESALDSSLIGRNTSESGKGEEAGTRIVESCSRTNRVSTTSDGVRICVGYTRSDTFSCQPLIFSSEIENRSWLKKAVYNNNRVASTAKFAAAGQMVSRHHNL